MALEDPQTYEGTLFLATWRANPFRKRLVPLGLDWSRVGVGVRNGVNIAFRNPTYVSSVVVELAFSRPLRV